MPTNATRNIASADIDTFLGYGWFLGLGRETCLIAWGTPKKSDKPLSKQLQFYIPDFYLEDPTPWLTYPNVSVVRRADLIKTLQPFSELPSLELSFRNPARSDFESKFNWIQAKIEAKGLDKAVPCVFAKGHGAMTKAARARHVVHLLKTAFKLTPFGYFTPTEGILGATPENLFVFESASQTLSSMALAGTRCSKLEKNQSILNDDKEVYEHQLVVKGLREKLSGYGELEISPTYVWDLGLISHLRTDLAIELEKKINPEKLFLELTQLLHPTAALGVAPASADWKLLRELENGVDRRRFGAPFGVLSPEGKSIAVVAIRNIQWDEEGVFIGTGCGVVAQSRLENEWAELELKRNSIYGLLGL